MKRTITLALGLALMAACAPSHDRDAEISAITELEQQLATFSVSANEEKAHEMIGLYRLYANHFPDDSLAPVYMMRSAEISLNIGENQQAAAILDSILDLYPAYDDAAICLFMKGQAYENNQQYDQARQAYRTFVEQYPDHYLAADTRKMLPLIGLTPEEQLEAILASADAAL